jgi:hypothetical protein
MIFTNYPLLTSARRFVFGKLLFKLASSDWTPGADPPLDTLRRIADFPRTKRNATIA